MPAVPQSNGIAAKILLEETKRIIPVTDDIAPHKTKQKTPPPASPLSLDESIITTAVPESIAPVKRNASPASTASTKSLPPVPPHNGQDNEPHRAATARQPVAGPSSSDKTPQNSPGPSPRPSLSSPNRKSSTFRHVPLRNPSARPSLPSSPLRPQSMIISRTASGLSMSSRTIGSQQDKTPEPSIRLKSPLVGPAAGAVDKGPLPPIPALELSETHATTPPARNTDSTSPLPYRRRDLAVPQPRSSSLSIPQASHARATSPASPASSISVTPSISNIANTPSPISSTSSLPTPTSHAASRAPTPSRSNAPYRPGFQPKGVYRPRTDEFLEIRRTRNDVGRVERTRLERRLEKLINLHFPHPDKEKQKDKDSISTNGRPAKTLNRRASSFFDIDIASLKGKSAGDLWRGVVQSQAAAGGKMDIRAAEQTITPWEDDAAVSQCPLCL
jgi:rabenosyn-5